MTKRILDRCLSHRGEPEALNGKIALGLVVTESKDQLALSPCVASVDDSVDVVSLELTLDDVELCLGAVVNDMLELEAFGNDGQLLHLPALPLLVVVLGLGKLDKVANSPGDDVIGPFKEALLFLEWAGQHSS
ncbi:unannotated protein [freshwater metagenome]|uniref:Unannotated protein n=1 Tax=freshwater metagenome TaxID=449393 RepID=A0A6J7E7S6_9ZZZZ